MKALLNNFFVFFIFLFGTCAIYAGRQPEKGPPSPTAKATATATPPPPPPGLPIDENIFILFSLAILLGIYIIYKNNLKAKNPI
jgi:hypothetical protein